MKSLQGKIPRNSLNFRKNLPLYFKRFLGILSMYFVLSTYFKRIQKTSRHFRRLLF